MTIARLAREIQKLANQRDLARAQQDRDQILFTLFLGKPKGDQATERYAVRSEQLSQLDEQIEHLAGKMRQALDDLTPGQAPGFSKSSTKPKRKKKRHHAKDH